MIPRVAEQRVAIARALIDDGDTILADDFVFMELREYDDIYFPSQGDDVKIENIVESGLSKEESYATVYKVKKINNINAHKDKLIKKLKLTNIEEITYTENIYLKNNDLSIPMFKKLVLL